jgi:type VI secretion system secreted protein Hcp
MFKGKRTAMLGTLVLALFLSSLILTNPGKALALDAFLKVQGIPGESRDDKHKDWIEVLSWTLSETQAARVGGSAGGAGSGKVDMKDFKVTMRASKASPKLFGACAKGEHIKEVRLEATRSGGNKQKFLEIKLSDVLVSSFLSMGSSGSGDAYPMEEVLFNFGKIEIIYTEMDSKTGNAKGNVQFQWDLKTNKGG